nr:putative quinone-oxidoreductase homolog, chloroplastic [Ipomoea batatas]
MAAAGRLMRAVQYDGYGGGAAALKMTSEVFILFCELAIDGLCLLQHVEVPVPTPKKDELLVKMEAVSINPVDWKVQEGSLRPMFPRKFPHIPGLVILYLFTSKYIWKDLHCLITKHVQKEKKTPLDGFCRCDFLYGNFNLAIIFPFFLARVGAVVDIAGEVVEVGSGVQSFKVGDKIVATNSIGDGGGLAEYGVTKETLTALRPLEVSAALPIAGLTAHEALTRVAGVKLDGSGPRRNILNDCHVFFLG